MFAVASAVALAFFSSVFAQPSPLTPLPAQEGQSCVITWTPDTTGKWTQTNIELMSGSNDNMVHLTTVTTNLDTTSGSAATFTWTCPDVTLYAAVYFYQFSHATEPSNLLWTTRWAIEGPNGQIVAPPNATQPGGQAIPWGLGELVDPSKATPAPSYITGEMSASGSGAPANGTAVTTASATMTMTMTTSMATVMTQPSVMNTSSTSSVPTPSTTPTSGAGRLGSPGSLILASFGAVFAGCLALM